MTSNTGTMTGLHDEHTMLRQRVAVLEHENTQLQQRVEHLEHENAREREKLYQSQTLLQTIIDILPQAIFWKDRTSVYVGCNCVFATAAGCESPIDLVGKTDYDMPWKPDEAELYRQMDQRVMGSNTAEYNIVETQLQADGNQVWVNTNKIPLHDADGNVVGILGSFEDITRRKQQEEAFYHFKMVVDNAMDGISFVSPDGVITYVNDAFKAVVGREDELVGTPMGELFGDDAYHPQEIIQYVTEHGAWQGAATYYHTSGRPIPTHLSVFAVTDEHGKPVSFPGFMRDMTAFYEAEAERAALQQQIIDAQRDALRELSTPLIPIADQVLVMPLVGTIDSSRAQHIMEALLEGVAQHRAELAILDITGVQVVDTQVASALVRAAQAVKLLGAQVVMTGIQPPIAQTLVQLGVDLQGIATRSTLQAGIDDVLNGNQQRTLR